MNDQIFIAGRGAEALALALQTTPFHVLAGLPVILQAVFCLLFLRREPIFPDSRY
jgi:hypothetical protein